jgi:sugar lactone lactonase YvrE
MRNRAVLTSAFLSVLWGFSTGAAAPEPPVAVPGIRSVVRIIDGPAAADSFRRPAALLVDPGRGLLLVADRGNHRVVILDEGGRGRGAISFASADPRASSGEPRSLAADSRGRLFIVDELSARVRVMTPRGSRLAEIELPVEGAVRPRFVSVAPSGTIWILYDGDRQGIAVLDERGRLRPELGVSGDTDLLRSPVAIAVRGDESVVAVADPLADRQILLLTPEGELITALGPHGESQGTLSAASHVTWGPEDTLWVTDTLRHSISVFDASGRYIGRVGGFGRGPGQFFYPVACGFAAGNRLVVLERGSSRLQVLDVGYSIAPEQGEAPTGALPPANRQPTPIGRGGNQPC